MANVSVNHLTFSYSTAQEKLPPVLNDVTLTFSDRHFSLLIGPSGTGKSTLLKLLARLYPSFRGTLQSGTIAYDDQSLTDMPADTVSKRVALLFQDPDQQFTMDTVTNELIFVLENLQVDPAKMDAIIANALAFVGITQLRDRTLATLSGGEKQKVALATIVAMDSDVILLDEPFASIDTSSRQHLIERLVALRDEAGKTIILADHDLSDYQNVVNDVFELNPKTKQISRLSESEASKQFSRFASAKTSFNVPLPKTTTPSILNLQKVQLTTGDRTLMTVDKLNIPAGKITLLTGENGAGKSTLFKALTRLKTYQGQIIYETHDIQKLKARRYALQVGLMFQEAQAQFLGITVAEELAISKKASHHPEFYSDQKIAEMLAAINLSNRGDQVVYTLSEGQKKKLQLLGMLITAPPVLLLDEPLKGLDLDSVATVAQFLREASRQLDETLIVISHQLTGLTQVADYHLQLANQTLTYQEGLS
ncbi:ABC transporter ATP-binding protein [Secundilactobacillus oryzae JCM 18671]|uniref:ABC transporter ATP-binding protein n=1 Tax=Secundilactobacillus oryzae JCM 18671 TaxID=1291743 RepID=A0A081BJA7_9LACO|nr:ATP-binding cassette domain-containing protein [Secundilactobacillus oryzae]GAK48125.1 ABC transporter ATP-binding protein [Secundilactobacillus oryzae JCM 18671]